jgi:peroxiredoxin
MIEWTRKTLDHTRAQTLLSFSEDDWASYRHLVDWLRNNDLASNALGAGDPAPDFLLPDAYGRLHSSEHLRRTGPLVVSFFRGGWCPFCAAELSALQEASEEFAALGATLVVMTPETRDFPRQLRQRLGLDLMVLSDVDCGVAGAYGVLFRVPEKTKAYYMAKGLDLGARHGSSTWMLPIPATYVIDCVGRILQAFVDPDFTSRPEPEAVLEALRATSTEA